MCLICMKRKISCVLVVAIVLIVVGDIFHLFAMSRTLRIIHFFLVALFLALTTRWLSKF